MKSEVQNMFARMGEPNAWETFAQQLANFAVVDVGKIERIVDGIATVQTFYAKGSNVKRVQAEIVMIGNASGFLSTIDVGQPCIVFYPRSPSKSLARETIDDTFGVYNEQAAKCLPITTYSTEQLVSLANTGSSLAISTSDYSLYFEPSSITLLSDIFQILLNEESLDFGFGADGVGDCLFKADGSVELTSGRQYDKVNDVTNWKNSIQQNPDGSIVIQGSGLVNSSTHESFGKSRIMLDTEGNITIEAGIDEQGEVQTSLTLQADGNLQIATQQQYSIAGTNGVVVDGADGKVSIKNSSGDLKSLLDTFADNLKTDLDQLKTTLDSFQTAGSPANHTAVPGQLDSWQQTFDQNVDSFKSDMGEVFE